MDWMKVFRTAEMSGATSSVWLWLILVFVIFIKSSSAKQINITAVFGESVTLPCRVLDGNKNIDGLEWSKPELETEYVLLYRDGHLGLFNQHPSFKDRVDLQDRQMKDGDVSLILKNVTTADAGIYAVRKIPETKRRKRANLGSDPICIINLSVFDPPVKKNITAGENVILPCQAPNTNSNPNTVVEWSRADLKPKYVLLYRNKQFDPDDQHPSFMDRVDLQDRQIKDGDVSLILKNVTTADAGIYEMRMSPRTKRRRRANLGGEPICIIYLHVVDPPGQPGGLTEDGAVGLKVGLSISAVLLIVGGGFLIYSIQKKQQLMDLYHHSANQQLTCEQQKCKPLLSVGKTHEALWGFSLDRCLQARRILQTYKEKVLTL
ncbi:uncharacterized protein LOC120736330 isoform X1 [Simochromis diagramma]|uniref:uncharacterized protein LOC120736330 isoform X1 n=1 Tax=Simochromis diagramma TaxID=43689 RepID=UPI001A7F080D|nr:uncharacterized protein LOC120736330 isoform X1 [Simochromis diagramma]